MKELNEVKELAFQLADRYISIQETSGGYDYTIYDTDYRELDGGIYDNPAFKIYDALNEIVLDLKNPMHRGELEGNIHDCDELIPMDYDILTTMAEYAEKHWIEEHIQRKKEEKRIVAEFKAKTEKMLHSIDGLTQGDIESDVYAYLYSKINEYEIAVGIVDMAISGSRCRGLERPDSDLDIVVEYEGWESEDVLFNIFNEDEFIINGVKVDINPITEKITGTLGVFLPTVETYLTEKNISLQNEKRMV